MAIFPNVMMESVVQVGDMTRLDATRSSVTPSEDSVASVEIEPETGLGFKDCTSSTREYFLDWAYETPGTKTVSVRVTTYGGDQQTIRRTLSVITEAEDALLSTDADLVALEPSILNYIRPGRNSFKDVHRQSLMLILDWLDEQGIRSPNDSRLGQHAFVDKAQVRKWATYLTLQLIFEGLSNVVDDVFAKKASKYESFATKASNRIDLKLDRDGDGDTDDEAEEIASVRVGRR